MRVVLILAALVSTMVVGADTSRRDFDIEQQSDAFQQRDCDPLPPEESNQDCS